MIPNSKHTHTHTYICILFCRYNKIPLEGMSVDLDFIPRTCMFNSFFGMVFICALLLLLLLLLFKVLLQWVIGYSWKCSVAIWWCQRHCLRFRYSGGYRPSSLFRGRLFFSRNCWCIWDLLIVLDLSWFFTLKKPLCVWTRFFRSLCFTVKTFHINVPEETVVVGWRNK